jgi:hypothetical protein
VQCDKLCNCRFVCAVNEQGQCGMKCRKEPIFKIRTWIPDWDTSAVFQIFSLTAYSVNRTFMLEIPFINTYAFSNSAEQNHTVEVQCGLCVLDIGLQHVHVNGY